MKQFLQKIKQKLKFNKNATTLDKNLGFEKVAIDQNSSQEIILARESNQSNLSSNKKSNFLRNDDREDIQTKKLESENIILTLSDDNHANKNNKSASKPIMTKLPSGAELINSERNNLGQIKNFQKILGNRYMKYKNSISPTI